MNLQELLDYYGHRVPPDIKREIIAMVEEEIVKAKANGVQLGEVNTLNRLRTKLLHLFIGE